MVRGFLTGGALLIGLAIVIVSIFRTSRPSYTFYQPSGATSSVPAFVSGVEYYLPYPGILPTSPLWFIKALRDKVWLLTVIDRSRRAEILLLLADKRLGMVQKLIKEGRNDIALVTAQKAEQDLNASYEAQEEAFRAGTDTTGFVQRLAAASLKHREILEQTMIVFPEGARPVLAQTINIPKDVYEKCVYRLNARGAEVPAPTTR